MKLPKVYFPVSVFLAAYIVTTGIGAALFPFSFGQEQLREYFHPQPVPLAGMTTLGSPTYWALLLTVAAIPIAAAYSARLIASHLQRLQMPTPPLWFPVTLAAAIAALCFYKLAAAGGLDAAAALDPSICYQNKITRRAELAGLLGNTYYGLICASLPILGAYLLVRGLREHDRRTLLAFAAISLMIAWLDLATMQKTPLLLYVLTIGLALAVGGFGGRYLFLAIGLCGAIYWILSDAQFCTKDVKSWEQKIPTAATQHIADQPARKPSDTEQALYRLRAFSFRMAAGFPFYIQTFSDPAERCGIERSWLHIFLGEQRCFPPTRIFPELYPNITYTTGYQPAPVNVSGYAEAGPLYALLATLSAGILIGLLSAFARGRDAISVSLFVAACLYAYYVSQASLTGSLFDNYGLIWLLFPIVMIYAAGRLIGIFVNNDGTRAAVPARRA